MNSCLARYYYTSSEFSKQVKFSGCSHEASSPSSCLQITQLHMSARLIVVYVTSGWRRAGAGRGGGPHTLARVPPGAYVPLVPQPQAGPTNLLVACSQKPRKRWSRTPATLVHRRPQLRPHQHSSSVQQYTPTSQLIEALFSSPKNQKIFKIFCHIEYFDTSMKH
jgi:hypothetical protein